MHPTDLLIRRLRIDTHLTEEDADAIRQLPVQLKKVASDTLIVREGDRPGQCCLLVAGFACRAKESEIGRRQILSFHIPGDIPDLQSLFLKTMDHDLATISPATLGFIDHAAVEAMIQARPAVARALWRETLIESSIFREWIVNIGAREAPARMAHLLAELRQRMIAIGLANDNEFEFPITQIQLSEALGMSAVHVNRVLQAFRAEGTLDLRRNMINIIDYAQVVATSGFDDAYLHMIGKIPSQ